MTEPATSSIRIAPGVDLPSSALRYRFGRGRGPGGQNVNKVNTRVGLTFDVDGSPSLSPEQKRLIDARLASRISKLGLLRIVSNRYRSQAANREAALEVFVELLKRALKRRRPRKKTRVPRAVKRRRIEAKKRRGALKRDRAGSFSPDE